MELGAANLDPPFAFTTLFNWPPKMALNSEGRKLWVLVIAVFFLGPTVSQLSSSLSSVEETKDAVFPFPFEIWPSSLSNSSCIWCMMKLRNSWASSCLKCMQNHHNQKKVLFEHIDGPTITIANTCFICIWDAWHSLLSNNEGWRRLQVNAIYSNE